MDSATYSHTVADAVNEIRKEQSVSVLALSTASGIPNTTLDRKLRHLGEFTIREAHALAAALGVSLPQLLIERVERISA